MAGPNTKKFRLPVNTGVRTDTFAETVPLMDINNFVLTPDGSALRPREGSEVRYQGVEGAGVTRKTIFFIQNPPDIDYGDLVCIVNNAGGVRKVEQSEVVKAAVIPDENGGLVSSVFRINGPLADGTLPLEPPYTSVSVDVNRNFGDIFGVSSVKIKTTNGTALAGTDYTAIDQTLTYAYGETSKTVTVTTEATSAGSGKTFTISLYDPSSGSSLSTVYHTSAEVIF